MVHNISKAKKKKVFPAMEHVAAAERVFLHKDGTKWYLVRPYDFKQVEISYSDPSLEVVQKQTAKGCTPMVIVDSAKKDPNIKPAFAHKMFKNAGGAAFGAAIVKCQMLLVFDKDLCIMSLTFFP